MVGFVIFGMWLMMINMDGANLDYSQIDQIRKICGKKANVKHINTGMKKISYKCVGDEKWRRL